MFEEEHRDQLKNKTSNLVPFLEKLCFFREKVLFILFFFILSTFVSAQTCNVAFPGVSNLLYSNECGTPTADNLTLGITNFMGDGDSFTFDSPNVINLSGNISIRAEGNARIIIPAGVTVNINGGVILQAENGGCSSTNSCNFEFQVNGKLNIFGNFLSNLDALVWSGVGSVTINGNLEYSNCMVCSPTSCPAFPTVSSCNSIGNTCGSSFCISGNIGNDCPLGEGVAPDIVNCPEDIIVQLSQAGCTEVVSWSAPEPGIECRAQSFTSTHDPGDAFPLGTTLVTYTMVDTLGASFFCTFSVTVEDVEDPVITNCPSDIVLQLSAGECTKQVNWTAPGATDNCAIDSFTSNFNSGDSFPFGVTMVEYIARDTYGNTTLCNFNVTIEDNIDPIYTGIPNDISVFTDPSSCNQVVSWSTPLASDNCTVVSNTSNLAPGSTFSLGVTEVIYTATDQSGNSSTARFNVTVTDNVAPVFSSCPSDIIMDLDDATCDKSITWTLPEARDNCSTVNLTVTHNPGDIFPLGTTLVEYIARDDSGNLSRCTFNVTLIDNSNPVINNCPADITLSVDAGQCTQRVNWTVPEAVDNCTITNFSASHTPGSEFPLGNTTVTYVALDQSGNREECSFTVTVQDLDPPVVLNCPANIDLELSEGECDIRVDWNPPSANDACSSVSVTASHDPGDVFTSGLTRVLYTFTDQAGNISECGFNINITDNNAPEILNCPQDILINLGDDECEQVVSWTPPTTNDNCSGTEITSTHNPGDSFSVGTTAVIYTVTDISGNSSQCQFNITLADNLAPVISSCPENITVENGNPSGTPVFWDEPRIEDNCDLAEVKSSHRPGDEFRTGTTTVTYTAQDGSGNQTTCSFEITVDVDGIFVYKSFTPDGDNINDTWRIENIQFYPENQIRVFDRWGTPVYEVKGYDNSSVFWDGVPNRGSGNGVAPTGTYFYSIDLGNGQGSEQGFIELVR